MNLDSAASLRLFNDAISVSMWFPFVSIVYLLLAQKVWKKAFFVGFLFQQNLQMSRNLAEI